MAAMRKRNRVAVASVAALLLVLFFGALMERKPSYQGKNLDEWLLELHELGITEDFGTAIDAMGTNSLEHLLRYSTAVDSPTKIRTFNFFKDKLGATLPLPFAESRRGPALAALMRLGSNASPIIPNLAENFEEKPSTMLFPMVFIQSGSEPVFLSYCQSTNQRVRVAAAEGLARVQNGIGYGHSKQAGAYTTNALFTMYLTLGDSLIDWVTQNLTHSNVWVRRASADFLYERSRIGRRAIPALKRTQERDESPLVREAAERAISAIEGHRKTE